MTRLQTILLMIASDIDALFKKNNIPYFLDGGSALGAVRHHGFIPWDDDFDIIILPEYYDQVIEMFKSQLDPEKYSFTEALVDWPLHISKIKLKGTHIREVDAFPAADDGIYIDVFCFDNASNNKIIRFWQLICCRIWLTYLLSQKTYTTNNLIKKTAIKMSKLLEWKPLREFIRNQSKSSTQTKFLSMAWARKRHRWTQYFCKRSIFSSSKYIDFENISLPVCIDIDKYLTTCFGDYMKLPPVDKRFGIHIKSIDYGKY